MMFCRQLRSSEQLSKLYKFYKKKTVGFSGIQTRIVGVKGMQTDPLTTTTAPTMNFLDETLC